MYAYLNKLNRRSSWYHKHIYKLMPVSSFKYTWSDGPAMFACLQVNVKKKCHTFELFIACQHYGKPFKYQSLIFQKHVFKYQSLIFQISIFYTIYYATDAMYLINYQVQCRCFEHISQKAMYHPAICLNCQLPLWSLLLLEVARCSPTLWLNIWRVRVRPGVNVRWVL